MTPNSFKRRVHHPGVYQFIGSNNHRQGLHLASILAILHLVTMFDHSSLYCDGLFRKNDDANVKSKAQIDAVLRYDQQMLFMTAELDRALIVQRIVLA